MRKHRILDGSTGNITVVPFTKKEDSAADKLEADAITQLHKNNSDDGRIEKVFTSSDKDVVLFDALFEIVNRLSELEGNGKIDRLDLTNWLIGKLPAKSI